MKKIAPLACAVAAAAMLVPSASYAQRGLSFLAECIEPGIGLPQRLAADRLEAKLAISPQLTAEQRERWLADIRALRAVTPAAPNYVPVEPMDPGHPQLGFTPEELQALSSMGARRVLEIRIACERDHGGVGAGPDEPFLATLRSQLVTETDVATIPLGPLPTPFRRTREEEEAERRQADAARFDAAQGAAQQANAALASMSTCAADMQKLPMTLRAELMQRKLDGAQGLSAADRAAFEADIAAVRQAAVQGLAIPAAVDPANPMRAMTRLSAAEQQELMTQYAQQLTAMMQACAAR
jgi:hypothetical protein